MRAESRGVSVGEPNARRRRLAWPLASALASSALPAVGVAVEKSVERRAQCERRGITRVVELRETPGAGLPCEVVYLKPDEDGSATALWTARADRGFCTARFDAFLVKLESKLDWACELDGGPAVSAASSTRPTLEAPGSVSRPNPTEGESAPRAASASALEPDAARTPDLAGTPPEAASVPMPEPGAVPAPDLADAAPATASRRESDAAPASDLAGASPATASTSTRESDTASVPDLAGAAPVADSASTSEPDAAPARGPAGVATAPPVSLSTSDDALSTPASSRAPPAIAAALPESTADDTTPRTPFERLLALAPSGRYVAVPMPSNERASDVRVDPVCPPDGRFTWRDDDPERPVLALGGTLELTVRPPAAALDETSVLGIVSSVGEGPTREVRALSFAPSGAVESRRAIDLRVAPLGPGSGALSPSTCRYALEG